MPDRLRKLAAGSYDVILDGVIIAGIVRSIVRERVTWTAELLISCPSKCRRPSPQPSTTSPRSKRLAGSLASHSSHCNFLSRTEPTKGGACRRAAQ